MKTDDIEYKYKMSWTVILLCALGFGACAGILGNLATTNDRGLTINNTIRLSQNAATTFYWTLCGLSLAFVALSCLVTVHRLKHKQRILLTGDALLVPASRWSSEETTIPYRDIASLSGTEVSGQRFLYVYRTDGKKFTINASFLPTKDSFDDVCEHLHQRTETI